MNVNVTKVLRSCSMSAARMALTLSIIMRVLASHPSATELLLWESIMTGTEYQLVIEG